MPTGSIDYVKYIISNVYVPHDLKFTKTAPN